MRDLEILEPYLEDARRVVPPSRDGTGKAVRRQRVVHALRERLAAAHGRRLRFRLWTRIGLGALTLTAAATALVLVLRPADPRAPEVANAPGVEAGVGVGVGVVKGTLRLTRQGVDRGLAAGEDVVVGLGDSLETNEQGGAQLMLSDIASLTMSPGTRVAEIAAQGGHVERIRLTQGRAHLWVSKLRGGRRFHVITPDVDVQVRGTEFDVELGAGPGAKTCVRVQEGLVMVTAGARRELLEAGRSWGCGAATAEVAPAEVTPVPEQSPRAKARPPATRKVTSAISASDLRIQNALFQRGLRAERASDYGTAAQMYQRLLERFPEGPLSGQAEANLAAMPAPR